MVALMLTKSPIGKDYESVPEENNMKRDLCRHFRVLAIRARESPNEKAKTLTSGNGFADRNMSSSYATLQSAPMDGARYPAANMNRNRKNATKTIAQVTGQSSRLAAVKLLALSSLFVLVACNNMRTPNPTNFTNAINHYLAMHGQACTSIGREFPIDVPASTPQSQYGFGPQLLALQQTGLVSEADSTAVVHGILDSLRGSTPPQPVRRYHLTPEGQKYFQQVPGIFGQTGGLCYGQKAVDSILKWTDPMTVGGRSQTEVRYTYKVIHLAGWAGRPEIQQVFPNIKATVDGASKTSETVGLQLTDNGWEVIGH